MRMKYWIVVAFILSPLCQAWAAPAPSAPLADRIPADAIIYVGWAGAQSMGPAYDASHLKAVLDSSQIPQMFNDLLPQISRKIGRQSGEAAEMTQLVSAIGGTLWRHPSAMYFGGVDWSGVAPMPRIAILCEAGAEADAMLQSVTRALQLSPPGGPPLVVRKYGSLIALAMGQPDAVDAIFASRPASALIGSPSFNSAIAQVQQDGVWITYVDVRGAVKLIDDCVGHGGGQEAIANWPKVRDALGLSGFNQAICTSGFDGKEWSSQGFIGTDGGKKGLLRLFSNQPLDDAALSVVPKSADRMFAGRFDLGEMVREIRSGIEQFDPNAATQFDEAIAQGNAVIGLDIQKDLIDPLGDQWTIYTDRTMGGSGLFDSVLVNHLKNPARAEAGLSVLADRGNQLIASLMKEGQGNIQFRHAQISGLQMTYLPLPLVSPAWVVKDSNLYLALYPQIASSAALQAGTGESILQSPAYQAVQQRLGNHKGGAVSFVNLPIVAAEGYGGLLAISQLYFGGADVMGVQMPPMVLPPFNQILPHLSPMGSVSWSDEVGWHYRDISPFPGSGALTGAGMGPAMAGEGALMASILLPSLNRARETANRVKCASNERMIGQAMLLYSNENKGAYPPDLGALIKTEDITAEVFICPSGSSALPPGLNRKSADERSAWVNENSDYVYVGKGMKNNAPADRVVLYEKPGAHNKDGMNILYGDGHVEFQTTAEAMRQIRAQEKKPEEGL